MKNKSGFTLIELLTVIAIIAILAAIIFPVMNVAKENANKTKCSANMNQIQAALQLYKNDNNRYPEVLAGFVEFNGSAALPLGSIKNGTLFREYVKGSTAIFSCPNNPVQDVNDLNQIVDDPLGDKGPSNINRPAGHKLYLYDSYDCQKNPSETQAQPRYSLGWCNTVDEAKTLAIMYGVTLNPGDEAAVFSRQLKFRNPPSDTIVTWCGYHRGGARTPGTGMDLVLTLDGTVHRVNSSKLYPQGAGTNLAYPYTVQL